MSAVTEDYNARAQSAIKWRKRLGVQRRLRLLQRLLRMSPTELAQRLGAAVSKHYQADRISLRQGEKLQRAGLEWLAVLGSDPGPTLQAAFDRRFFFGPERRRPLVAALQQHLPEAAAATVAEADALLRGQLTLLGQAMNVDPTTISWRADPLSGELVWPDDGLDEALAIGHSSADPKYVWELNRHQYLPTLGRAYWLTGDSRYARRAAELLDTWLTQNPAGRGINWCSHLEVGMRAVSWLWSAPFLLSWPDFDKQLLERWLQGLAQHYQHLRDNLSVFTDPTNHLIGETTALWMLVECLPDLPEAESESRRCRELLLRELEAQVHDDGVNCEQASSYHRFVTDFYLQFLALSRHNGNPLPPAAAKRIEAMLEFASALAGSGGSAPMTGDSDDARGIPLSELLGWDFRDLLVCGALLFQRGDWKAQAGGLRQLGLWLTGVDSVADYANLPADRGDADVSASEIFPAGGHCFFRGHKGRASELIFDCGPLGLWPNAAHGHADALSVMVRLDGKIVLGDPGTGTYFSDPELRNALRSSAAHNTLTVDGLDQADIFDVFKWVNPMRVTLDQSYLGARFDFATASHNGYARLRRPLLHTRSVLSSKDGRWIVLDRLQGRGEHRVVRHFHFAPEIALRQLGDSCISATANGSSLQLEFAEGTPSIDCDGRWSTYYGEARPAPRLRVSQTLQPPATLVTFLSAGEQNASGAIRRDHGLDGAIVLERSIATAKETLLINPDCAQRSLSDSLSTAAELAYVRKTGSRLASAFAVGGSVDGIGSDIPRIQEGRFTVYG